MGRDSGEWTKRVLAIALSAVLSVGGLPAQAFAEAVESASSTDIAASNSSANADASRSESAGTESTQELPRSVEGGDEVPPSENADLTRSQQADEHLSDLVSALATQVRGEAADDTPKAEIVSKIYRRLARTLAGVDQDEFALELKGRLTANKDAAHLFKLVMEELKVECIEVAATDDSATWNMVEVDGAWYHVDAWRAGERYAELLEGAEDASAVEVPLDWLLVGDKRMAVSEDSPLRWKRFDGEKVPESAGDYVDKPAEAANGAVSEQEDGADAQQVEQDQQGGEDSQDAVLTAQGTTIVDSGTCGTCPWSLDSEGTLTIGPGTLANNDENYDVNY